MFYVYPLVIFIVLNISFTWYLYTRSRIYYQENDTERRRIHDKLTFYENLYSIK